MRWARKPRVKFKPSNSSTITSYTKMTKHVTISAVYVISIIDPDSNKTLLIEKCIINFSQFQNLEHSTVTLTVLVNAII